MFELILLTTLVGCLSFSAWIDTVWLALISVVVYVAVSWLFMDFTIPAAFTNPISLIMILIGSLAVGSLWSLWKWRSWMHSDQVQKKLRSKKQDFDKYSNDGVFKDSDWFPSVARPSENIDRIVSWIVLWPFSMLIYVLEDMLVNIGRWIYERLGKIYVRITDAALDEDMR